MSEKMTKGERIVGDYMPAGWSKEGLGRRIDAAIAEARAEERKRAEGLRKAAKIYKDRYMLDEIDSEDNCTWGRQQHIDAVAVHQALATYDQSGEATTDKVRG